MNSVFVPQHGPRPRGHRLCIYTLTGDQANDCGRPATWHVMWDGELANSLTCEEHMELIKARWMFDDRHPVGADCNMPGAIWSYRNSCCYVPTDDMLLTASQISTKEIGMTGKEMADFASQESQRTKQLADSAWADGAPNPEYADRAENLAALAAQAADLLEDGS